MYGIQGQPIIELDNYIDHAGFTALVEEQYAGIAKSEWTAGSFGPGVFAKDLGRDLFHLEMGTYLNRGAAPLHPEAETVRRATVGMTLNQRRLYLKLKYGLYNSGSSVYLRIPKSQDYQSLNRPDMNEWTANCKHFPKLVEWIKRLPMESLGRVLFFVNEHRCPVIEHSDMHHSKADKAYVADNKHSHEFIWIKPQIEFSKSFYVLDEQTGAKHYVKGNSAWFNSFDVHGGDPCDTMTWSLRVDGVFKPELRKALLGHE